MLVFKQTENTTNKKTCSAVTQSVTSLDGNRKKKKEFEKYCIISNTPTDKYVNDSSVNKDIKVCVN